MGIAFRIAYVVRCMGYTVPNEEHLPAEAWTIG